MRKLRHGVLALSHWDKWEVRHLFKSKAQFLAMTSFSPTSLTTVAATIVFIMGVEFCKLRSLVLQT